MENDVLDKKSSDVEKIKWDGVFMSGKIDK